MCERVRTMDMCSREQLGLVFVNWNNEFRTIHWGHVIRWWLHTATLAGQCEARPVIYFNGHLGEAAGDGGFPGLRESFP
jgi:hypothetical protein